jgi:hypothetical protein
MAELQVLDASFERLIDSRAPIENIATEHHHVRVFDLGADGSLRYGRVCAQLIHNEVLGRADGMKLDVEGNLYVAGNTQEGIWGGERCEGTVHDRPTLVSHPGGGGMRDLVLRDA